MQILDKVPLELVIDISLPQNREIIKMTKTVYAGFIPQHGMEVIDTEIFFRVRTTANAGLQTLRHSAFPLRRGKFLEGSRRITSKLFPKDEPQLRESVEFFSKQGWTIE